MSGIIDKCCKSYEHLFDNGIMEIWTTDKMLPLTPLDAEKSNALADIMEILDDECQKKNVLWGKQMAHGLPTATYLDRDASILNISRDTSNHKVVAEWKRRK